MYEILFFMNITQILENETYWIIGFDLDILVHIKFDPTSNRDILYVVTRSILNGSVLYINARCFEYDFIFILFSIKYFMKL